MIPSFSIVGISPDYEKMARQIQDDPGKQENLEILPALVAQIEEVFGKACSELEEEYHLIKSMKA
jgi:hypothetical protein